MCYYEKFCFWIEKQIPNREKLQRNFDRNLHSKIAPSRSVGWENLRQPIEKMDTKVVWNFVRVHEILNQTNAENFSCLNKKVFFQKKYKPSHMTGICSYFSTNRWRLHGTIFELIFWLWHQPKYFLFGNSREATFLIIAQLNLMRGLEKRNHGDCDIFSDKQEHYLQRESPNS